MKDGWRLNFLIWLFRKVLKIPVGQIMPKHLIALQAILMPVDFFLSRQKTLRYDFSRNCLYIDGKEYDRYMFSHAFRVGNKIEIISTKNGVITYKILDDKFYMEVQNEY